MNGETKVQAAEMLEATSTENVYEGFTYEVRFDDTINILKKTGEEQIVSVPDEIDGKKVISIASMCFNHNDIVKEITFPSTIRSYGCIGYSCSQLEKITINTYNPGKEAGISKNTFKEISKNVKIKVPKKKFNTYKSITEMGIY